MKELLVESNIDSLEKVTEFVVSELQSLGCSEHSVMQIKLVIDELFSNICYYAYGDDSGPVTVGVGADEDQEAVHLSFSDNGKPYNPLDADIPDVDLDGEDRPIGGLGIFIVREMMDDITYEYKDGRNTLLITKKMCSDAEEDLL